MYAMDLSHVKIPTIKEVAIDLDLEGDIDFLELSEELALVSKQECLITDLEYSIKSIEAIKSYIEESGVTPELLTVYGAQLEELGVHLVSTESIVEGTGELQTSLEGMKFKELLQALIDKITAIIEKIFDANRKNQTKLIAFGKEKLADIGNYNEATFDGKVSPIFEYAACKKFIDVIGKIDYTKAHDVRDNTVTLRAEYERMFKELGYSIDNGMLVRDEKFSIERKRLSDIGWKLSNLKPTVTSLGNGLKHIRDAGKKAIDSLNNDVKGAKADDPELSKAIKERIGYTRNVIMVTERVSNLMSRQVLGLSSALVKHNS